MTSSSDGGDLLEKEFSLLPSVSSLEELDYFVDCRSSCFDGGNLSLCLDRGDLSNNGISFLSCVSALEELDFFMDCIPSTVLTPPDIFDMYSLCLSEHILDCGFYAYLDVTSRETSLGLVA